MSMYHYTICGLDNVWLKNGYVERDTPYGKAVAVVEAQQLHHLLALGLVDKPGRLTGKELKFLRVQMGLSQAGFAKMHGVSEQAVSLWERHGKVPSANDQLARVHYLAQAAGDTSVKQAIERVKTVEKLVHQRIVVRNSGKKWLSAVEIEDGAVESA